MRKEDLKAELGKINPPEDLIRATLLKMEEAKEKKENSFLSFVKGFRYKTATLATACCALVLILGIGVMTGNRKEDNPSVVDSRMRQDNRMVQEDGTQIAAHGEVQDADITWVKGVLLACGFSELTAEEEAEGVAAHGVLTIEKEDGTVISADMLFADGEASMQLTDLLSEEIYFAMVCEEKDGETRYRVTEVSSEEKK